jgi:hypothetical protein
MAAATRPGPAEARVPCPLCGGLIHPIAGRCKHCKGDLREYRSTRPAAGATLPALSQPSSASHGTAHGTAHGSSAGSSTGSLNGHVNGTGHGTGHINGHGPATNGYQPQPPQQSRAQAAAALSLPVIPRLGPGAGPIEAVQILPPRPTGPHAAPAPRAAWPSWPVIVIILAVIAIVAAVVLMLFPPGGAAAQDEGTNHSLQPAPDRMNTDPAPATPRQPPSAAPDPWSRGGSGSAPTKPPSAQATPDDPDIDDPDVDDALASRDPFSRRGGGAGGLGLGGGLASPRVGMLYSIIKHACTRLSSCGATTPQTKMLCDVYTRVPAVTPSCSAATRCLRSIDDLSCDALGTDASALWQLKDKLDDCSDAMSC